MNYLVPTVFSVLLVLTLVGAIYSVVSGKKDKS